MQAHGGGQGPGLPEGWRRLDGGLAAWFDAPSLVAAAGLVRRVMVAAVGTGAALPDLDVRPRGVRVRVPAGPDGRVDATSAALVRAVDAAAADLGLAADPAALQTLHLALETPDPGRVLPFWRAVLGYDAVGPDRLADPGARDAGLLLRRHEQARPLRGRVHLDVVRPAPQVEQARAGLRAEPHGPYGVRLADPDGTEVDLVPGDALPGGGTEDWHALFSAVAGYRVPAPDRLGELVTVVAGLADDAGVDLLLDVRRDTVTLDSGKDRWEDRFWDGRFPSLAARVQEAARRIGDPVDASRLRFVQVGLDAVDVPAAQRFWGAVLGRERDEDNVMDVHDPRRGGPVLLLQEMDPAEPDRLRARDRLRPVLCVPEDALASRLAVVRAAGGRVVAETPGGATVADPEGIELEVVAG